MPIVTTSGLIPAASPASGIVPIQWAVAAGSSDAITAAYSTPNTALTDGLILAFRASAANATTTPSFSPDGLTAHVITRFGGQAVVPGDIAGALAECLVRYNLANTRWELLNPSGGALSRLSMQIFTASGTYFPTAGLVCARMRVVGGGGSGGGCPASAATSASVGSGGGSGGVSEGWFSAATIGASQAVTIGPGGVGVSNGAGNNGTASSVGSLITANGGTHGAVGSLVSATGQAVIGGAGATPGTGTGCILLPGSNGGTGSDYIASSAGFAAAGIGAPGFLGQGAGAPAPSNGGNGGNGGANTGAGGGGASSILAGTGAGTGGTGGSGLALIEEFIF